MRRFISVCGSLVLDAGLKPNLFPNKIFELVASSIGLLGPGIYVRILPENDFMPLVIPDETLRAAGMNEREARVEIACRLFDAGKLAIGHAARLAGLSEAEIEAEFELRGIPRYRYTEEMLEHDVEVLKKLGRW